MTTNRSIGLYDRMGRYVGCDRVPFLSKIHLGKLGVSLDSQKTSLLPKNHRNSYINGNRSSERSLNILLIRFADWIENYVISMSTQQLKRQREYHLRNFLGKPL